MATQLLFAVGASGVGKTAGLQALHARALPGVCCHHFDSIGVPSITDMTRIFGSPERWQELITHEWVRRLKQVEKPVIILEGQTRPSFIRAALGGSPLR